MTGKELHRIEHYSFLGLDSYTSKKYKFPDKSVAWLLLTLLNNLHIPSFSIKQKLSQCLCCRHKIAHLAALIETTSEICCFVVPFAADPTNHADRISSVLFILLSKNRCLKLFVTASIKSTTLWNHNRLLAVPVAMMLNLSKTEPQTCPEQSPEHVLNKTPNKTLNSSWTKLSTCPKPTLHPDWLAPHHPMGESFLHPVPKSCRPPISITVQ